MDTHLDMSLVVVVGAAELGLLADGLAEYDALFEQEYVELLAAVVAPAGHVRHYHGLLQQQLALRCYVALQCIKPHL